MVWQTTYVPITVGIPQSLSPFLQYYRGRYLHPRGITATVIPITAVNTAVLPQSPSPCQCLIIGENLRSKFGHARLLGSRIIHYVRDGRTNRPTNGQKQCSFPLPYGRRHNNWSVHSISQMAHSQLPWWDAWAIATKIWDGMSRI